MAYKAIICGMMKLEFYSFAFNATLLHGEKSMHKVTVFAQAFDINIYRLYMVVR